MKPIILLFAIFTCFLSQAQENFIEVKPNTYRIDKLDKIEYIGNGIATWLLDRELYQLNVESNNSVTTKKIENSGINLLSMTGFDFNVDGNKDLFVSRTSSFADGVLRYRYENGDFQYAGVQNYLDQAFLQYVGDFDNDGDDDCIYKNFVLLYDKTSGFRTFDQVAFLSDKEHRSLFVDVDEDGDNDVLFSNSNGISYYKNNGTSNLSLVPILEGTGYSWIKKIKTEDGEKVLFQKNDSVYELVKNGEVFDSIWVSEKISTSTGQDFKIVNINDDENEEIVSLFFSKVFAIQYIGGGNFKRVELLNTSGLEGKFLVDDQETVKIVSINQSDIQIYEFTNELELNLAATIENQIIPGVDFFADLNGDGFTDIVGENNYQSYLGGGEFGPLSHLELPNNFMKFNDIDGDGDDDYYSTASWHENLGDGVFGPNQVNPNYVPLEYLDIEIWFTTKIASADLDNDGDIDHLSYNNFGEDLLLYENNDDISYSDPIILAESNLVEGDRIKSLVRDFNNDGLLDIIMVTASGIVYFHNEGDLNFKATENLYDKVYKPKSVDIRDGNGDGFLDVIVGTIRIFGGSATGELVFCPGTSEGIQEAKILASGDPHDVVLFGLNENGIYDLYSTSKSTLWRFRSSNDYQSFVGENIIPEGTGSNFIIKDLDSDEDIDIILYSKNTSNISYFLKNENFSELNCPSQSQILRSQSQVDEYQVNYGQCEELEYSLSIIGDDDWSDISSLNAFVNLKSIKGDLEFEMINKVTEFEGFANLEKIGGSMIMESIKPKNFNGFSGLKEIGGDFSMVRSWPLPISGPGYNFNGMVKFEKLGGGIDISYANVVNIDKLITGNSIGGDLMLDSYSGFTDMEVDDLSKLSQIDTIEGTFKLGNVAMTSGNYGLDNLKFIGGDFDISDHDNLQSIDNLEDDLIVGGEWNMSWNSNLTSCNVLPLCRHIANGGKYSVFQNGSDCISTGDIDCNDNKISGVTFFDFEKDGVYNSTTDGLLSSVLIQYNDKDPILTSGFGQYAIYPLEGEDVTLKASQSEDWIPTTATSYDIPNFLPGQSNTSDLNFGFTSTEDLNSFEGFMSFSVFVCNESFYAHLNIKNKSSQISNGLVRVHYNEYSTLDPTYISYSLHNEMERFIEIPFENVYPFFEQNYSIPFLAPDEFQVGNPDIKFKYEILVEQSNNELVLVDEQESNLELLCSYDPNDKLVNSTDNSGKIRVNSDDRLYYTIRFQNTGNYYATDVRIEDEIDKKLDLSTFEFVSASHDVSIRIIDRKVVFYFNDIDLIESDDNFLESQGYVTFSIKPNSYSLGTGFENQASIFFDQNSPIITNVVGSKVYDPLVNTVDKELNKLSVFPVPSNQRLFISIGKSFSQELSYEVFDMRGSSVLNGKLFNNESLLIDEILDGIYTIMITSDEVNEVLVSRFVKISK